MSHEAALTLFELEPAPCRDHGCPALPPGWQELVAEVGYCKACGEVVWIRLADFDETGLLAGREAP